MKQSSFCIPLPMFFKACTVFLNQQIDFTGIVLLCMFMPVRWRKVCVMLAGFFKGEKYSFPPPYHQNTNLGREAEFEKG